MEERKKAVSQKKVQTDKMSVLSDPTPLLLRSPPSGAEKRAKNSGPRETEPVGGQSRRFAADVRNAERCFFFFAANIEDPVRSTDGFVYMHCISYGWVIMFVGRLRVAASFSGSGIDTV